jgi:ABC-type bacteriocin/lantibiotic exporter with double-glycine peptidase domain
LINGLESFYDVLTSLDKIGQVVDKELEPQSGEQPPFGNDFNIELKDVTYKVFNKEIPILSDINLNIKPKTSLLIKGGNGSGKSSLLRLIAGVIKPSKGNVFLGLFSLENVNINYYRSHIGLSLFDETPFEGTIRENITFGNSEISDDAIFWAIENVGLNDFIKDQLKGLETILYPEGIRMSTTIAKKIILARAIVKKPRMLILENPLDQIVEEEANRIIKFLTQPSHDWTIVVVSQNKHWEKVCQQTIELKEGKIISKI